MTLDHRLRGPEGAPVVVLSNSLGTTSMLWERQLPELETRFRVLTYDHPGHGASPPLEVPRTIETLAHGLLELLDDLGLERISMCGVSLGGMVAMALALDAPDRVDRLVVACTSAHLGPPEMWEERASIVRAEGVQAIALAVAERWFTADADDQTVQRFRELLATTPAEGYARCCEAIASWDVRERLREISSSTLVVAGADDPATPVEHAEFIASRIPGARLRVLERAAHLANVERAPAFNTALLEHLEQEVVV
jgi:3-oxoadipate enol-lactonase